MPESARGLERVAAVVLAAGGSRRLGQPKQLVTLAGETLLGRAVRLALEVGCGPVVVVLGAEEAGCRAALTGIVGDSGERVRMVSNGDWREGMSTSLRAGLAAVAAAGGAESMLMMVSDQARVTAGSLRALLGAHAMRQGPVTAARYGGRLGVPAIFDAEVWPAFAELSGDQGARSLLVEGGAQGVDMPEAAFEVDTPEDLAVLSASVLPW